MTQRLDQVLVSRGLFASREKARRAVMAGAVQVDGRLVDKPGAPIAAAASIEILQSTQPFVSRAGEKLDAALDHFGIDVREFVCLDVGASTGGFTQCLLLRGARRVYAVDVGYGQLDYGLRNHPRVVVMERVNARYLDAGDLPEPCDLITMDLSFISLTKVVPAVARLLAPAGRLLPMIKPQFEAGRGLVGKGGVIRDEALRRQVVETTISRLEALGLRALGSFDSPVFGAQGNREVFALFRGDPDR